MENFLLIGSEVGVYTYATNDMINLPSSAECVIYRAKLMEPGRFGKNNTVAVKKFHIDSSKKEATQLTDLDLLRRWQCITNLKHENVIPYHQVAMHWMHSGSESVPRIIELNIVMDYCDGCTLITMVHEMTQAKRTFPVKTLFDFSKQIASGLAYIHAKNIMHGDLKGSSVLVNRSSENHFRVRLCGLDNFVFSYAAFVQRSFKSPGLVPPEVLTIIREGASVVRNDPYFSALCLLLKPVAKGDLSYCWAVGDNGDEESIMLMDALISNYESYANTKTAPLCPGNAGSNQFFLEFLQDISADVLRSDEEWSSLGVEKEAFLQFLDVLQNICAGDPARAQEFCTRMQKVMGVGVSKAPGEILDNVMATYFQHMRVPSISESEPSSASSDSFRSNPLSVPSQSMRHDGRKTDIWSLGRIMTELAACTFDTSLKFFYSVETPVLDKLETMHNLSRKSFEAETIFYDSNFVPKDFKQIVDSCMHRSVERRITAGQLIDKLVALEEHTYGSTWMCRPLGDGVADDKVSGGHREMIEEIGCKCTYNFNFRKDFVGQGAHGHVYKAEVIKSGNYKGDETVAVKLITLGNDKIKKMQRDRIWRQPKKQWLKLISLKHPHLVAYHRVTVWKLVKGAGIDIMMDYCEGGDLDKLITQCRTRVCSLSLEAVCRYTAQLAIGLQFLHENQFIHGDVKPGNVFMNRATGDTGNRILRIGDLDGAVRVRGDTSKMGRFDLAGTGPYMSPEMVMQLFEKEHENIGFPTDIWSLGCVILDLANCSVGIRERLFYKMVANVAGELEVHKIERKSFSADAFLFQLSQGYHPFVSDLIYQDVRGVIQRCLVPACKDRATAALVLEQLLCDENGDPR